MDRSPGFGSIIYDLYRPIQTRFCFGSMPYLALNLAIYNNSLDRSTKSTISRFKSLYLLVNTGFQVLFHSPPGVLFTVPSRYLFSIGYLVVFSLTGWSPLFHTRFLVSRTTLDLPRLLHGFHIQDFHLLWSIFPDSSTNLNLGFIDNPNPSGITTSGLGSSYFARHYFRNRFYFLFLWVLRCFSSPRSLPIHYFTHVWIHSLFSLCEFPHSDICGSMDICSSPQLFAAYHVLLRLLVPRHSPYALCSLTSWLRLNFVLLRQLFVKKCSMYQRTPPLFCSSFLALLVYTVPTFFFSLRFLDF